MKTTAKSGASVSSATLGATGAVLVCLFGQLAAIGLLGPDEPRYVWIARAMAQTGDWVTPRLYGQPWFEKPILYYWAAALGFRLHFSAEWAARLPSALAALAAVAGTAWLARRLYGRSDSWFRDPATITALISSTTVAMAGFARAATPDMLFSAAIVLAMICANALLAEAGVLRSAPEPSTALGSHRAAVLAAFGAFLGLGVLAKGPAAVILAGGTLCVWALATGRWRNVLGMAHPVAIAAFCAVALPWYVLCALRNPDFLRVFILQHNFERYLTPVFQHRQPFWFFGPIFLAAMLPWTALLIPAAVEALRLWREKSWRNSPGFFLACWSMFPIMFFSFSQSKLPSYILPAIPPAALVCGVAWIRLLEKGQRGVARLVAALSITWIALAIAGIIFVRRMPWEETFFGETHVASPPHFVYAALAAILLGAVLIGISGLRHNAAWGIGLCVFCFVVGLALANLVIVPRIDGRYSGRSYAEFLKNYAHPDRVFCYQLPRAWTYGLAFYFQRELPEWSPSDPDPALVLATPQGLNAIIKMGRSSGLPDGIAPQQGLVYVPVNSSPRQIRK